MKKKKTQKDIRIFLECSALEQIGKNWERRLSGPAFSPLGNLDGRNAIVDAIEALKNSAVCLFGTLIGNGFKISRVLDLCLKLYERAMDPWEQFRTLHGVKRPLGLSGSANSASMPAAIYSRWPYGTFSKKTRREAKFRYWELRSASRFSVDEVPNKRRLEQLNPPSGQLKFQHLVGMVATVCVVQALEEFHTLLRQWSMAIVEKQASGVPLRWMELHNPNRLQSILDAYHAGTTEGNAVTIEAEKRAVLHLKNAEVWLALSDMHDHHQAEIERTAIQIKVGHQAELADLDDQYQAELERTNNEFNAGYQAELSCIVDKVATETIAQTLEEERLKKSIKASVSAQNYREKGKKLSAQEVADYFNAITNSGKKQKWEASTDLAPGLCIP